METNSVTITDVPVYPDVPTYLNVLGSLHIWEGDGWKAESLSWKTGAYIASNLSGLPELNVQGTQRTGVPLAAEHQQCI